MDVTINHRVAGRSPRSLRIAGATLALFGAASLVFAPATARAATSHATSHVLVMAVKNANLGTILVSGRPLYTLVPSSTACRSACLKIWPEVLLPKGVVKATAGAGVNSAKLGTVRRAGGALQVTYAGRPLYFFVGDSPGSRVRGDLTDTWGKWHCVVTKKIATAGSTTTTTSAPSGGGVGF